MGNSDLEKNFVTANDTCVQDKAKFPDEPILITSVRDLWHFAFGTDPGADPYQKLR